MPGKSLAKAAEQEAFEEAGIRGQIEPQSIGHFDHVKSHPVVGAIRCTIALHPLAVEEELADWPERNERERRWFDQRSAQAAVQSRSLKALIGHFRP